MEKEEGGGLVMERSVRQEELVVFVGNVVSSPYLARYHTTNCTGALTLCLQAECREIIYNIYLSTCSSTVGKYSQVCLKRSHSVIMLMLNLY